MVNHLLTSKRTILVTSALPYANGDIHLGHLVEYIQTDIWVRFLRLMGHTVYYVCADDAHGTAISIAADKCGETPETMIQTIHKEHEADLRTYGVDFDNYYSTHSEENKQLTAQLFHSLREKGHIYTEEVSQLFDEQQDMFLADRFVKGNCPRCNAADQYGDNCDVCGHTYSAIDLKNPVSVYTGTTPTIKQSKHYFFRLEDFRAFLHQFVLQSAPSALHAKLLEWFDAPLKSWDISRDAPYFGFVIPGETDKYFYVWLDAPVGYMASLQNLCKQKNIDFDAFWHKDSDCELYHFIGKDIVYFHALFWAAILQGSGHRVPNGIFAHGFLTINGMKMSKSKNTFITARDFAQHTNPETVRYYFAHKLSDSIDDIDLNIDDYVQRINSDLVGKIINIASRASGLLKRANNNQMAEGDISVLQPVLDASDAICHAYVTRQYNKAIKEMQGCADSINRYFNDQAPWQLIKTGKNTQVAQVCSTALNGFYLLCAYLQPVMPELCARAYGFLRTTCPPLTNLQPLPAKHAINNFSFLLKRIESADMQQFISNSND